MTKREAFSFDLYPGIDSELDAAFSRNGGSTGVDVVVNPDLGAVVTAAIKGPNVKANLAPMFVESVDEALANAQMVLGDTVQVPDMADPELADIDWPKLNSVYPVMIGAGLEPAIIVTPSTLRPTAWEDVFNRLNGKEGLKIDIGVSEAWSELHSGVKPWIVSIIPTIEGDIFREVLIHTHYNSGKDDLMQKAEAKGLEDIMNAIGIEDVDKTSDLYPDIDAYLMLQAIRLNNGQEQFEKNSLWLKGLFDNGSAAVSARYDIADKVIRIKGYSSGSHNSMGVRPTAKG